MNSSKPKYLIIIAGATATGKTDIAIQLAKHFNTEIISADARQFYRELNIGTAKPSPQQLKEVPHHFINSLSVQDAYDVGKYETDVLQFLDQFYLKHDIVILCGGSGLFIKAITDGLDELPQVDPEVRKQLKFIFEQKGILALQDLLKEKDPAYYSVSDINNPQRLMRALEVCISTGQPFSSFHKNEKAKRNFIPIKICLNVDRNELYQRIGRRVDEMFANGLLEEAKQLFPFKELNALQTVGYTELFQHFENKIDLGTAKQLIKQHTRNYAKRQITWFKKDPEYSYFDPKDISLILKFINSKVQGSGF